MLVQLLRMTALVATIQLIATPYAISGECVPTGLSSYSSLGRAMAKLRDGTSGELLAIWLLESPDPSECKFVFRVDRLLSGGSIVSMTFDARTLEEVTIESDRGWTEYGGGGQTGEASASGGNDSSSGSGSSGSGSSGSGSSGSGSSGSGDDSDSDDSDSDSDDHSGSGSSGSGSDSSGSGSGGDDSSGGGGSGGSGSGSGGSDD